MVRMGRKETERGIGKDEEGLVGVKIIRNETKAENRDGKSRCGYMTREVIFYKEY